jgi:hypothetical protein
MIQTMRALMFPVALLALLLSGVPSDAAGSDLMLLRLESLDAALEDARTLHGKDELSLEMFDEALGLFGIEGSSHLETGRPLAIVMPMQGLMLAQRGLVAALPVRDIGAVLDSMAASFERHSVEDDGLQVFGTDQGMTVYVRPEEGYLILGGNRDLVAGFEARAALAPEAGPPGNLRMDLHLAQAAPMVKMGLMGAKQQVLAQMQQRVDQGGEALPFDAARMGPILDVYFGLIGAVLDNVSQAQVTLEVRDGHLILHERLLPTPGSTFAGLVAAQGASAPSLEDLAGVASHEAVMVSIGDMEMTEAARTALRGFLMGYLGAALPIAADLMGQAAGEEAPALPVDALLAEIDFQIERLLRCSGSRSASSFDFAEEGGLTFYQAYEWSGTQDCRVSFAEELARTETLLASMPFLADLVSFAPGPEVAGAATATTEVRIGAILPRLGVDEPEARKIVAELYGETLTIREAYGEGWYVVASGAKAEARLASPFAGGGSLDAFRPLAPGAASYARFDAGRMLSRIGAVLPAEAAGDPGLALVTDALQGPAGRLAMGVRFDGAAATFEAAVPFEAVRLFLGLHERMNEVRRCPRSVQECVDSRVAEARRVGLIGLEGVYLGELGGYRVDSFVAGGKAEAAGVRVGDILARVNGIPLSDGEAARADAPNRAPGMTVELTLLRGGEEVTLHVEVIEKPAELLAREIGEHLLEGHAGR